MQKVASSTRNMLKYMSQPERASTPPAWLNQSRWSSMSTVHEEWRPVVGYEGLYEVSDLGRIRRASSHHNRVDRSAGTLLKPQLSRQNYLTIKLSKNGHEKRFLVHRLVLAAFIPPPSSAHVCNHKDGNKNNPCLENLEWVTLSENSKHAYRTGLTFAKGSRNGRAKLTEQEVLEIRSSDQTSMSLAGRYGVGKTTIRNIKSGKSWGHLP